MAKETEPNYVCTMTINLNRTVKKRGMEPNKHIVSESTKINNRENLVEAHDKLYSRVKKKLKLSMDGDKRLG